MASQVPRYNKILAALPVAEYGRLLPFLECVEVAQGDILGEGEGVLYFPVSMVAALVGATESGATGQLALVGNDGLIGAVAALGGECLARRFVVVTAGEAYRLRGEAAAWELEQHGSFFRLAMRYMQSLFVRLSQTALCNLHHSVEQRLCRWLLNLLDYAPGDRLAMTHAFMATQLGVRREAVSEAAARLQTAGLIEYQRGIVRILDRSGLETRACSCYAEEQAQCGRLFASQPDVAIRHRIRPSPASLRQRAEERFRTSERTMPRSLADMGKILDELEIRRYELEIQNEEIAQSYAEADSLRARYADLYDFSPVAYVTVDAHGGLRQTNLAGAILIGVKRSEVGRYRFCNFVHPEHHAAFDDFLGRVLAGRVDQRCEIVLAATARHGPATVILDGVADEDATECRMVLTDVTAQREAERRIREKEQYLQALLDNFPFMVWLKDRESRFLAVNQPLATAWGYDSPAHLVGKTDFDSTARELAESYRADDLAVLVSGRGRTVEEAIEVGGIKHWFETYKSPISMDGHIIGTVGFARDITERKERQLELQAAYERLQLALHAAGAGCWEIDFASGKQVWSPELFAILGLVPGEDPASQETWRAIVHPDDRRDAEARFAEALRTRTPFASDHRIVWKNGDSRWIAVFGRGRYAADGKAIGFMGIVLDITERKAMEGRLKEALDQAQRLEHALDHVSAFIYLKDRNLRFVYGNRSLLDFLGATEAEFFGSDGSNFFSAGTMARLQAMDRQVLAGQAVSQEVEVILHDGRRIIGWDIKAPLYEEGAVPAVWGLCGVSTDVTERRRAEEELLTYKERLEELVAVRTRELTVAKTAAESANIAKSAFLANMSHEIRTPLNGIFGLTELIRLAGVTPRQEAWLARLQEVGSRLLWLIDDLLEISKIESGSLVLREKPVDIASLVATVVASVAHRAENKHLRLDSQVEAVPGTLLGDAEELRRALTCYVENAIKFTEAGSIHIGVYPVGAGEGDVLLRFEVVDTGIGIAPDVLARLFSRFEQADGSATRKYGGLGLGLVIVRRLAGMMGGEAGAESEVGCGSTFWFTARLRKAQSLGRDGSVGRDGEAS